MNLTTISIFSVQEVCYTTISAENQRDIIARLGLAMTARIQIGSFPTNEFRGFADFGGDPLDDLSVISPDDAPYVGTTRLSSQRQYISNTILLAVACFLITIAIVRRFLCCVPVQKCVERDYSIVAAAMGWDTASSFA